MHVSRMTGRIIFITIHNESFVDEIFTIKGGL